MAEVAPIDLDRLRRTFEDDSVLAELFAMYVDDTAKRLADLRQAVSAGDLDRCRRTGHTLKGSSGNIGAPVMREIAAELESTNGGAGAGSAERLIQALEQEFRRAERYINEFITRVGA